MARFRVTRTRPRLPGTKPKHEHDSLHLIETARVKVNKARARLPRQVSGADCNAMQEAIDILRRDVDVFEQSMYVVASRG